MSKNYPPPFSDKQFAVIYDMINKKLDERFGRISTPISAEEATGPREDLTSYTMGIDRASDAGDAMAYTFAMSKEDVPYTIFEGVSYVPAHQWVMMKARCEDAIVQRDKEYSAKQEVQHRLSAVQNMLAGARGLANDRAVRIENLEDKVTELSNALEVCESKRRRKVDPKAFDDLRNELAGVADQLDGMHHNYKALQDAYDVVAQELKSVSNALEICEDRRRATVKAMGLL